MECVKKFSELGLKKETLNIIEKKGFKLASVIQEKIIPIFLKEKCDVIGISQTGSGKTASFVLPILEKIEEKQKSKFPKVLVLTPTRELAIQVSKEFESFRGNRNIKTIAVYGGSNISKQIYDIKKGADIIVGTPGRIKDLINRQILNFREVDYVVLDEADEMLKMGFIDEINFILSKTKKEKRTFLFSATMEDRVKTLSKKYMKNQKIIEVKNETKINKNIEQFYVVVENRDKFKAIKSIIKSSKFFYGIIFCQTKKDVDMVKSNLYNLKFNVDCIHGDIVQNKRERILKKFRSQKIEILVATDVASRGIDIKDLTHVINYSLPKTEIETYIHRIGRVARAGKKGSSISLVNKKQKFLISNIERKTKTKIKEMRIKIDNEKFFKKPKKEKNFNKRIKN